MNSIPTSSMSLSCVGQSTLQQAQRHPCQCDFTGWQNVEGLQHPWMQKKNWSQLQKINSWGRRKCLQPITHWWKKLESSQEKRCCCMWIQRRTPTYDYSHCILLLVRKLSQGILSVNIWCPRLDVINCLSPRQKPSFNNAVILQDIHSISMHLQHISFKHTLATVDGSFFNVLQYNLVGQTICCL